MTVCETPLETRRWADFKEESQCRTTRRIPPEKEQAIISLLQRKVNPGTIVSSLKTSRLTIQNVEKRAKLAGIL